MGKLTFGMMCSLDGYINDRAGKFEWGQVSEEVHRHAERLQANEGIAIYGRRMFETMAIWDTVHEDSSEDQFMRDFSRVWRKTEKIVVSRSLREVTTSNTRLVRKLTVSDIQAMKAEAKKDIGVSGPTLAADYLKQGLIDEVSVYYVPVVVGGGTPMFPDVTQTLRLELLDQRSFKNGVVFMRYRTTDGPGRDDGADPGEHAHPSAPD
jgi:dihydrofolate reductase